MWYHEKNLNKDMQIKFYTPMTISVSCVVAK